MLRLRKATSENQDNIDNIPDHIYDHVQNIIPECTDPNRK